MATKEIKISEVRSCGDLNANNIKEEDMSDHQVIRLKPINQLTKNPGAGQVTLKPKTTSSKTVVGSTTIRAIRKLDGKIVPENSRGIVLKKITKGNIQNPAKQNPQKVVRQQRIVPNEELRMPIEPQLKTYSQGPSPHSKPRIIRVIRIDGLTDEQVTKLPIQVINCIKKLQIENNMLKRKLADFRNETTIIAQHLLKVSSENDHINATTASPSKSVEIAVKRKLETTPLESNHAPEEKKIKKIIRMPKFPINTAASLSQFEKDLILPEFHQFVFQRLQAHLKSRNDINQENLFETVLLSMINADVLGEISYDPQTNSVASYQLCFKELAKFRDLYCKLLNTFSLPKFEKETEMQEVEEFLERKILMRGKILQYQKKNETGKDIKITKVVVNKSKNVDTNKINFKSENDFDNDLN